MDQNIIIFLAVGVLGVGVLAAIFMIAKKRGGGTVALNIGEGTLTSTTQPDPAKADLSRLQAEERNKIRVAKGAELIAPDAKLGKDNEVDLGG